MTLQRLVLKTMSFTEYKSTQAFIVAMEFLGKATRHSAGAFRKAPCPIVAVHQEYLGWNKVAWRLMCRRFAIVIVQQGTAMTSSYASLIALLPNENEGKELKTTKEGCIKYTSAHQGGLKHSQSMFIALRIRADCIDAGRPERVVHIAAILQRLKWLPACG